MKINGKPDGGGGGGVITSLSITSNGTYTAGAGVDGYSPVDVDVQPVLESLSVSANGTYTPSVGTDGYSQVSVNVVPPLQGKSVTVNGLVTPDEGYYGLSQVDVSVPIPTPVTTVLSVSSNNTYYPGAGVDGFSQVIVDVPQSVAGFTEKEITEETYAIYNLSNSASFVHRNVFEADVNLLTVNLPNASYVGSEAFRSCSNLTSVELATCETIYTSAFQDCTSLSYVSLPNCKSIDQVAFNNCRLISVDLPECETFNGQNMFKDNISLVSINIPKCSLIGPYMFQGCKSLQGIDLPICLSIRNGAFSGCESLSYVNAPSCMFVEGNAFNGCKSLSQFNFSNYMAIDTNGLFNGCTILEEITLPLNTYYMPNYNNWMLMNTKILSGTGTIYVPDFNYDKYISATGWSSLSSMMVSVPASGSLLYSDGLVYGGTTALGADFYTYLGIQSSSITGIVLSNCTYLQPVPGQYPERWRFREFRNLETLELAVESIPKDFMNSGTATSLQTLRLPNCTYISEGGFRNQKYLSDISLPNCEYIGNNAFLWCSYLTSIDFLPKCSYIGPQAFGSALSISTINLPECEYIDRYAFSGCISLGKVYLSKCSYLGFGAFSSCSVLSEITIYTSSVCTLDGIDVFAKTPIISGSGSIYVPTSLVDAYKSANGWTNFASIIFPIPEP